MCGIAGILTRDREPTRLKAAIERMTDALAHRGPDDAGIECLSLPGGSQLCLGHRRLSILDLSSRGHQPMTDPASGSWIVFNGEIYNHWDLRKRLSGPAFRSTSDTETLLRAWLRFGPSCLGQLRGIFAFAIYDAPRRELWLVRDHLGVKPLYFANPAPGLWMFASEMRSLLASGWIDRELSPEAIDGYLAFGAVQAPLTLVQGVRSLLPAEARCISLRDPSGALASTTRRFWTPAFAASSNGSAGGSRVRCPEREQLERLRTVWEDAVSSQLLSDVPVGVFLSGGIDSGAIAATLARIGKPVKTFSVVFEEPDFDESLHSRAVAAACGAEHHELPITPREILQQTDQALAAYDQPSVDGINTYIISKAVREAGIKVALSGLGGDEVFAGYSTFRHLPRLQRWQEWPNRWLLRLAGVAIACTDSQTGRWAKLRQLFQRSHSRLETYTVLRQVYPSALRTNLLLDGLDGAQELCTTLADELSGRADAIDQVNAVSLMELSLYMANMLLRDTDQMSMAHALEVRVPLLDQVLVDEIARLPGEWKLPRTGQPNKWLLVRLAGDRLPEKVVQRAKIGFSFPWDRWLRRELKARVEEELFDADLVTAAGLDASVVASLWRQYIERSGGLRYSDMLSIWHLVHWVHLHGLRVPSTEHGASRCFASVCNVDPPARGMESAARDTP